MSTQREAFEKWHDSEYGVEPHFGRDRDGQCSWESNKFYRWQGWQAAMESQWISVDDRLPEFNQPVICVKDRSKRYKHTIVEQDVRSSLSNHTNNWMVTPRLDKVTHWMPLPQPPKEKL
jgi:hypothetical protein